jgi:hypothetical protein
MTARVRLESTGDLTSVAAFFDPKFEARSTISTRCATRSGCRRSRSASTRPRSPPTSSSRPWPGRQAIKDKQVLAIKSNDYLGDLASGDAVLSMS